MGNLQSFALPSINFQNINCSCFNSTDKDSPQKLKLKSPSKLRYKLFICSSYKKILTCDYCAKLNKKNGDEELSYSVDAVYVVKDSKVDDEKVDDEKVDDEKVDDEKKN